MFNHLLEFAHRRKPLQAFGWYITWLLVGMPLGVVAGAISVQLAATPVQDFATGFRIGAHAGAVVTIVYISILGGCLVWPRRKDLLSVILAVVAICLATVTGTLGGLIPLAIITIRPASATA